jgi:hypothetical protein
MKRSAPGLVMGLALTGGGGGLDVSLVIGGTRVARLDITLSRSGGPTRSAFTGATIDTSTPMW